MSTDKTTTPPPPPPAEEQNWQEWGASADAAADGRTGSRPVRTARRGGSAKSADETRVDSAPAAASADNGPRLVSKKAVDVGPRRVRLSIARVDPWSVMKLSFLLSVAIGIMMVVAAAVVWFVLDKMQVFSKVQGLLQELGSEQLLNLMQYVELDRVMSMATILAVADIVILTALATLMAFLYNITASLVGGLHLTLTDD